MIRLADLAIDGPQTVEARRLPLPRAMRAYCSARSAFTRLLGTIAWLALLATSAEAASITVAWDPNTDPNIAGYIVNYGTASGAYTQSIDVGPSTSWTVNGLTNGLTYYLAIQAYNTSGQKSQLSAEVTGTASTIQTSVGSITVGWDPSTDATVAGYAVYYGPASQTYTNSIDAGNTISATVGGLAPGQYFLAVRSYNQSHIESTFSNEVSTTVAAAVAKILVTPTISNLTTGQSATLTGQAYDAAGNLLPTTSLTWSSNSSSVAYPTTTTGATTTATAAGVGTATISATSGSVTGAATVNVAPPAPTVAKVVVSPTTATIKIGTGTTLTAQAYDASNNLLSGIAFTWSTSSSAASLSGTSGASVSVTGATTGSATISATSGSMSGAANVTVAPTVAKVVVSPTSATINMGTATTLTAQAYDASNNLLSGIAFAWSTSSSAVSLSGTSGASVSVTGAAAGSANVTVTAAGLSAVSAVTVKAVVDHVTIAPSSAKVKLGSKLTLTATAYDSNNKPVSGVSFTWTTSNGKVATLSATSGSSISVKGNALGSATVTAKETKTGKSGTSSISVTRTGT